MGFILSLDCDFRLDMLFLLVLDLEPECEEYSESGGVGGAVGPGPFSLSLGLFFLSSTWSFLCSHSLPSPPSVLSGFSSLAFTSLASGILSGLGARVLSLSDILFAAYFILVIFVNDVDLNLKEREREFLENLYFFRTRNCE